MSSSYLHKRLEHNVLICVIISHAMWYSVCSSFMTHSFITLERIAFVWNMNASKYGKNVLTFCNVMKKIIINWVVKWTDFLFKWVGDEWQKKKELFNFWFKLLTALVFGWQEVDTSVKWKVVKWFLVNVNIQTISLLVKECNGDMN